ncbi:uncharacterized protein LY79DRAFT_146955 [Colletotrichum navitas]|uniref:Secreted protein n=1 Tax=Colletotrichum navitas TaxID=681940 RepID=A0AAD8QBS9_9PEZI|nr:uncharacterized protein LY79DRAFT_146955 [Colletotrichum navitas]KAK1599671.1 hypothetical protein LY79DRAFT_146955 [Colletotrichum navitas]
MGSRVPGSHCNWGLQLLLWLALADIHRTLPTHPSRRKSGMSIADEAICKRNTLGRDHGQFLVTIPSCLCSIFLLIRSRLTAAVMLCMMVCC